MRKRRPNAVLPGFAAVLAAALLTSAMASLEPRATLDFGTERYQMSTGERRLISVRVRNVPQAGLAAFQLRLRFDRSRIRIADPNEAFVSSGVPPFAPLGDSPLCSLIRESATCPDAPWFLTRTSRVPVAGTMTVDNERGVVQIVYGTHSSAPPPAGDGVIAVLEIVALQSGQAPIYASRVILADNGEPPQPFDHDVVQATIQVLP